MKKVFKALAITAATAAIGTGVAFATGCGGSDGKYIGYYCYDSRNLVYGIVVEVTVENNIITKVEDITATYKDDSGKGKVSHTFINTNTNTETTIDNTQWHRYSTPWEEYFPANSWIKYQITDPDVLAKVEADDKYVPAPKDCNIDYYNWFQSDVDNWNKYEAGLLQKYEGLTVSEIIDLKVFIDNTGEPYTVKDYNADLNAKELVISGATQGSGRIALAVQNALGKTAEIGRVK